MDLRESSIHGQRTRYRTAGSAPVPLRIHGMAGSATTWRRVMRGLARRFTVVAPELLGHGS